MNTRELDRLLCERLGIEPRSQHIVGTDHSSCFAGTERECKKWWKRHANYCAENGFAPTTWAIYPALSTTGDGIVRLMEALRAKGLACMVGQREGHYDGAVGGYPVDETASWAQADTAPLAIALAAAAALGIEVPND